MTLRDHLTWCGIHGVAVGVCAAMVQSLLVRDTPFLDVAVVMFALVLNLTLLFCHIWEAA